MEAGDSTPRTLDKDRGDALDLNIAKPSGSHSCLKQESNCSNTITKNGKELQRGILSNSATRIEIAHEIDGGQRLQTELGKPVHGQSLMYMTMEGTVELCVEKTRVGMDSSLRPVRSSQVGMLRDFENSWAIHYTTGMYMWSCG